MSKDFYLTGYSTHTTSIHQNLLSTKFSIFLLSCTHTVPPRITSPPHNFTVLENNFLPSTPSCQGTGVPAPTYSWFGPDGNSIPMLGDVPQFGLLTRSSSGSYACVATNRAGTARAEFNIVVEGTSRD